tara:strand:+ start:2722 stop:2964 length:243 start_codon:yes stop_codon:yes gene_type:complete
MDRTESKRREMVRQINSEPGERETMEAKHGQVWDMSEMQRDYSVVGFAAPLIVVRRKEDGVRGSLMFQHRPRYYYNFLEG